MHVLTCVTGRVDWFGCVCVPPRLKDKVRFVLQYMSTYGHVLFVNLLVSYAVVRQISMLFIDNKDCVFCKAKLKTETSHFSSVNCCSSVVRTLSALFKCCSHTFKCCSHTSALFKCCFIVTISHHQTADIKVVRSSPAWSSLRTPQLALSASAPSPKRGLGPKIRLLRFSFAIMNSVLFNLLCAGGLVLER